MDQTTETSIKSMITQAIKTIEEMLTANLS
jgi:hypothetical protein